MDNQYLRKQNAILQQRVIFLQSQLSQLKSSQSALTSKIQQINNSRSALVQKLNDLSKEYEDKIRNLSNRLQKLNKHNQILVKQGNQYKEEIQLFENRILQKERLLTSFVTEGGFGRVQNYQRAPPQTLNSINEILTQTQVNQAPTTFINNNNTQEKDIHTTLKGLGEQEKQTPPPPPPTMRSIRQSPKKQDIQKQKRVPPPPARKKIQVRPIPPPQQNTFVPEVVEVNHQNIPSISQSPQREPQSQPQPQPQFIQEPVEQPQPYDNEQNDFQIDDIGAKNLQQSQNFFNQLASNSFVSEIVPRDDNPQVPDTPFSHNFQPQNLQQSNFSQGHNFFDNLGQSQQFSEYQPSHQEQQVPKQNRVLSDPFARYDDQPNNTNPVNQMIAPPPKPIPKPIKSRRGNLQVLDSSSFQK